MSPSSIAPEPCAGQTTAFGKKKSSGFSTVFEGMNTDMSLRVRNNVQLVKSSWCIKTFKKLVSAIRPFAQQYLMSLSAQLFMVFLAIIACLTFVMSSYLDSVHNFQAGIIHSRMDIIVLALVLVDQITNFFFIMDFILNCVGCDNIFTYLTTLTGIADLVSGIPVSMIYLNFLARGKSDQSHWSIIRTLKFLKVARISRLTRLVKLQRQSHGLGTSSGNEEVKAEILNAFVMLFMLVFITVDIILILEERSEEFYIGCDEELCGKNLRWHDALYFTVVTLSTVGYGDIGPASNSSRVFIMFVIMVSFASVGKLVGDIAAAASKTNRWRTDYVPQKHQPHIILAGAPDGFYLKFFAELFSETQRLAGEPMPTICVLSPGPPSNHMSLLVGQLYPALQYIDGDVLLQHDLTRARAESAQAIMVNPTNCEGNTEDVNDQNLILTAISIFRFYQKIHHKAKLAYKAHLSETESIRRQRIESSDADFFTATRPFKLLGGLNAKESTRDSFSDSSSGSSFFDSLKQLNIFSSRPQSFVLPELCFQVGSRKTKDHLRELGMPLHAVSNQEFRQALTAVGTLLPGFITFFGNAVRSNPDMDTNKERWRAEYKYGASHEIYIVDVDQSTFTRPVFEGLTFSELYKHLLEANGTLLLAVGVTDPSVDSPMGRPSQVLLNPASMVLYREPKLERLFALGRSKESVDDALSQLIKVRKEYVETFKEEVVGPSTVKSNRRASHEHARRLSVKLNQKEEVIPWFIPKVITETPAGNALAHMDASMDYPSSSQLKQSSSSGGGKSGGLNNLFSGKPSTLQLNQSANMNQKFPFLQPLAQHGPFSKQDKGISLDNPIEESVETQDTSKTKLALEQIDAAMRTVAELGVQVRKENEVKRFKTGQSSNEGVGLVEAAGGMLGAARRAVTSLPELTIEKDKGSFDENPFMTQYPSHMSSQDIDNEEYECPPHKFFDGHIVIEAFSSSVPLIMSILVSLRRHTSLDVVILMSRSNLNIRIAMKHQLNHIRRSRCGRIGTTAVADNVYLLHDHNELNTDAITEARVGNAVAIILCRDNRDDKEFQSPKRADNLMMVKSSMICQGLVHHYRSATSAVSNNSDTSSFNNKGTSRMSVLALAPSITGTKKSSSKKASGAVVSPPKPKKRERGPRMSMRVSFSEMGGSMECPSVDGLEVKHFDLHVVHQLFDDMAVGFLGQSTEVPKFDKGMSLSRRKNNKFKLGLKKYSDREEENKSFEDDDSFDLFKAPHLSPKMKVSEFGSFQLLDDVSVEKHQVEEEGDEFFGRNITSKRLSKLYDDALFNYPIFAAGRVFADSLMELLMAQAYFNPNEICFWEAMLGIDEIDREQRFGDEKQGTFEHSMAQLVSFSTKPSQLIEITVPSVLVGANYGVLLDRETGKGNICLGLYRPSGTKSSTMPYMCTNPPLSTTLVLGDRLMIITPMDEKDIIT